MRDIRVEPWRKSYTRRLLEEIVACCIQHAPNKMKHLHCIQHIKVVFSTLHITTNLKEAKAQLWPVTSLQMNNCLFDLLDDTNSWAKMVQTLHPPKMGVLAQGQAIWLQQHYQVQPHSLHR
jgi:hypothetical protein